MARRPMGAGWLGLRALVSLEPWTIPGCRYPNLLATGEVCRGDTIHDKEHPHHLFVDKHYMGYVRRFILAVVVSLLTFSTSGLVSLAEMESCTAGEPAGRDDGACAPTCVTCGCCVQAVEPAADATLAALNLPAVLRLPALIRPPAADPRDVLHVPKRVRV